MSRTKLIGAIVAALVVSLLVVAPATAESVRPAQLQAQGWTCLVPLPFPDTIVCGNPAHGLPPVPPIRTGTRHTASCSSTWTGASAGRCT